jgi:hypothetical protein
MQAQDCGVIANYSAQTMLTPGNPRKASVARKPHVGCGQSGPRRRRSRGPPDSRHAVRTQHGIVALGGDSFDADLGNERVVEWVAVVRRQMCLDTGRASSRVSAAAVSAESFVG